jgi:cysteine desulfuration protein SufE
MSADALTPAQIQQQIADELALFGDWSERYQYLIDLAKTLPPYPPELKDEAHLLKGCQSQVFVHVDPRADLLQIHAVSDSSIVSGLIALVLRVYSGQTPHNVMHHDADFMEGIGLNKNLSMTRKNGLKALLQRVHQEAAARL